VSADALVGARQRATRRHRDRRILGTILCAFGEVGFII